MQRVGKMNRGCTVPWLCINNVQAASIAQYPMAHRMSDSDRQAAQRTSILSMLWMMGLVFSK